MLFTAGGDESHYPPCFAPEELLKITTGFQSKSCDEISTKDCKLLTSDVSDV